LGAVGGVFIVALLIDDDRDALGLRQLRNRFN
jgi:hypothetical protein